MPESNVRNQQLRFLHFEFLVSVAQASTRVRNGTRIYIKGANDKDKASFRQTFREMLNALVADSYQGRKSVDDDTHEKNICELAQRLTGAHPDILEGRRFRIGPTQKALNLYLKYLWCSGEISEPPHCPFDRQIIGLLGREFAAVAWTNLDDIKKYRRIVCAARRKANGLSLAQWELRMWNERNIQDQQHHPP